ncbi:unnamed protein product, partial [Prorocentrum cordatum]
RRGGVGSAPAQGRHAAASDVPEPELRRGHGPRLQARGCGGPSRSLPEGQRHGPHLSAVGGLVPQLLGANIHAAQFPGPGPRPRLQPEPGAAAGHGEAAAAALAARPRRTGEHFPPHFRVAEMLQPDDTGVVPYADVAFDVGPEGGVGRFLAHRIVVVAQSPVLLESLEKLPLTALPREKIRAAVLRIDPRISQEVWRSALQFMYTGVVSITYADNVEKVVELLRACVLYQLPRPLLDAAQSRLYPLLPGFPPQVALQVFSITSGSGVSEDPDLRPAREASAHILIPPAGEGRLGDLRPRGGLPDPVARGAHHGARGVPPRDHSRRRGRVAAAAGPTGRRARHPVAEPLSEHAPAAAAVACGIAVRLRRGTAAAGRGETLRGPDVRGPRHIACQRVLRARRDGSLWRRAGRPVGQRPG